MKYFGTDGIRGLYNTKLTVDLAFKIGKAAGVVFKERGKQKICIGKDPRISSDVLESALIAGLVASGINVIKFGVISTPVISFAIKSKDFDAGVMISASHNPFYDNGIKFFGKDGKKLNDELELAIETKIIEEDYNLVNAEELGTIAENTEIVGEYIDYVCAQSTDLTGKKILLDCANGATSQIAWKVFRKLGAEVRIMAAKPDGININDGVGSTHPEAIANAIKTADFDFGVTYDGDGDRLLIVSNTGEILDGDHILYALAVAYKTDGKLRNNLVVSTVMANLGLVEALKNNNIELEMTAVGDRYVMKGLDELDAVVGGEQSGHIILPELLTTGDGILVSAVLAKIFETNISIEDIQTQMVKFPQVLINKQVENRALAMKDPILLEEIAKQEAILGESGRILVRASGTEELVRVMVEAKEQAVCQQIGDYLIQFVK
ncbi:MAG: phosphoglucosamine mutase [Mycoplasmatales bacterium]